MIVVDASVAIKWVIDEDGKDAALALLDENLTAPPIWRAEIANVLSTLCRRGELTASEAELRLDGLLDAPVTIAEDENDLTRALLLSLDLGHPIYDCLYLALAIRQDACVVTADRRFVAAIRRLPALSGRVRLLGE